MHARLFGCVLFLAFVGACGSKTGLPVESRGASVDAGRSDTTPDRPCLPTTPEVLLDSSVLAWAEDGDRLWVTGLDPLGVGWLARSSGEITGVAEDQFGLRSLVADDGIAWWTHSGFSDFAGELVRADRRGRLRVLHDGLFQPGGVQLAGDEIYYAEWTNSGSVRDEMRGRILRIDSSGGRSRVLADGLGLPTDTALEAGHVYWVDRRRDHVARVDVDGGEIEVVAAGFDVESALSSHAGAVYFASQSPTSRRGTTLHRIDLATLDVEDVAELPTEVRGLVALRDGVLGDGVLVQLWYGDGRVGNALIFVPVGGEPVEIDPAGARPVLGARHLYWTNREALMHVCIDWLATL